MSLCSELKQELNEALDLTTKLAGRALTKRERYQATKYMMEMVLDGLNIPADTMAEEAARYLEMAYTNKIERAIYELEMLIAHVLSDEERATAVGYLRDLLNDTPDASVEDLADDLGLASTWSR